MGHLYKQNLLPLIFYVPAIRRKLLQKSSQPPTHKQLNQYTAVNPTVTSTSIPTVLSYWTLFQLNTITISRKILSWRNENSHNSINSHFAETVPTSFPSYLYIMHPLCIPLSTLLWNLNGPLIRKDELHLWDKYVDMALITETHFTGWTKFYTLGYKTCRTNHTVRNTRDDTAVIVRTTLCHYHISNQFPLYTFSLFSSPLSLS